MNWYDNLTDRQRAKVLSFTLGYLNGTSESENREYATKLLRDMEQMGKSYIESETEYEIEYTRPSKKHLLYYYIFASNKEEAMRYFAHDEPRGRIINITEVKKEEQKTKLTEFKKEFEALQNKYGIRMAPDIDYEIDYTYEEESYISGETPFIAYYDEAGNKLGEDYDEE